MQPDTVEVCLVALAGDGPGAASLASGVFPFGLDALLEQVHVGSRWKPAGWDDIVVQAAHGGVGGGGVRSEVCFHVKTSTILQCFRQDADIISAVPRSNAKQAASEAWLVTASR